MIGIDAAFIITVTFSIVSFICGFVICAITPDKPVAPKQEKQHIDKRI